MVFVIDKLSLVLLLPAAEKERNKKCEKCKPNNKLQQRKKYLTRITFELRFTMKDVY
jgi:hypothetical protein